MPSDLFASICKIISPAGIVNSLLLLTYLYTIFTYSKRFIFLNNQMKNTFRIRSMKLNEICLFVVTQFTPNDNVLMY